MAGALHLPNPRRAALALLVLFACAVPALQAEPSSAKPDRRDHWAYRPLTKPAVPAIKDASHVCNAIDAFVVAALEAKGLAPSPPADKRVLIRRLYFDLTGLPPTPEEVSAFLADGSADAYERLVDRLLASPRYGERWARHWLDVVHYGESHGYGMDRPRLNAWPYRDYVIRSFNEDTPYARFVQEQVAGDVLFPNEPRLVAALGFLASGPWNQSAQAEQNDEIVCKRIAQNLDRDDMVMTTFSTFTSTTVHCARCHDHKFDPISQAEYYNLQSVFAGVDRVDRPIDLDPRTPARRKLLLAQQAILAQPAPPSHGIELPPPPTTSDLDAWQRRAAAGTAGWAVLNPTSISTATAGTTATRQPDGSVLFGGARGQTDTYTFVAQSDVSPITALRVEILPDDALPHKGPGRQENGNCALNEIALSVSGKSIPLVNPSADFEENGWGVAAAIDGNLKTAWAIFPEIGKPHVAVFETKEPIKLDTGSVLTIKLDQQNGNGHVIGRLRLAVTGAAKPPRADAVPYAAVGILSIPAPNRTEAQSAELTRLYRNELVDRQLAELGPPQMVYAVANTFTAYHKFHAAATPRPVFLLRRGDVLQPIQPAQPGALSCVRDLPANFDLPNPNDEGARRAALARWLSDPKNALTWRSIVNRVWQYHFGRGIVETSGDFGHMGTPPSHPELLDWLASSFLENGGSIKQLHRLILNSATYRQSSAPDERAARVDGGNVSLWRMQRSRLDAECVRDTILQITGMVDLAMGGPSVKQFTFEDPNIDVTPKAHYDTFNVDSPDGRRRSIYRYLFRTLPDPFMDSLDCPDPSQLTARRNESVTALQALSMLNDRFVVRYSEHLAQRVANAGGVASRIKLAYELALCRQPDTEELRTLERYAAKHGMANTCRVILNCNEFLFVD